MPFKMFILQHLSKNERKAAEFAHFSVASFTFPKTNRARETQNHICICFGCFSSRSCFRHLSLGWRCRWLRLFLFAGHDFRFIVFAHKICCKNERCCNEH